MKKYRESDVKDIIESRKATEYPTGFVRTEIIVWIGSSEYWNRVFLDTVSHKLYVKTGKREYEAIETLNIRQVGSMTPNHIG